MIVKCFSIYDTKAECFNTPFFMPNEKMALRAFNDLIMDSRSTLNKHPNDYVLYELGEFDDEKGKLEGKKLINLGIGKYPEINLDKERLIGKDLVEVIKSSNDEG